MRLSISAYTVVALLCAVSCNCHFTPPPGWTFNSVEWVNKVATDIPGPRTVIHEFDNFDQSARRTSSDLPDATPHPSKADNSKLIKYTSPDVSKPGELYQLQGPIRYMSQDQLVELIGRMQIRRPNIISSIHPPLNSAELEIKNQIKGIIKTANPDEFLHQTIPLYNSLIERITKENKRKLKRDPGQYFQALIIQKQKNDDKLDDFSRARAVQLSGETMPESLTSVGSKFIKVSGAFDDLEEAFCDYIMVEGLGEIIEEIQTAANSKLVESLLQKTSDKNFELQSSDIMGLYRSNDPEDVKWLQNVFRDISPIEWLDNVFHGTCPTWLNPQEIVDQINKNGMVPQELLEASKSDSPVLNKWLTDLSESKTALPSAVRDKQNFIKTLIVKYTEDHLDIVAKKFIELPTSMEVLLYFAAQHGKKLKFKAEEIYLTPERFLLAEPFQRAIDVFDPDEITSYLASDTFRKDLAKALVEYKKGDFHPASTNPTHNLDNTKPKEIFSK